ncbi:MAG: nicotinamide-nucleotide adenylyltransferase [Thermoplasmata archaeon]|nr:MAG: nicotinamide-nucleotide adenylyltransferase [Thermoplasmata archaeon]
MRALILGRYQPFHNGHLEVIKEILEETDSIIIAIGSAQHSHSIENPFTAGERYLMISNTLNTHGITNHYIVPIIDINRYALWVAHVESMVPPVDKIYTHNPLTKRLFSEKNYEVVSPKIYDREKYSGQEIRRRIIESESWHDLVPNEVVKVIEDVDGVERLRELAISDEIGPNEEEIQE